MNTNGNNDKLLIFSSDESAIIKQKVASSEMCFAQIDHTSK